MIEKNFVVDKGLTIVGGGNIDGVTNLEVSANISAGNLVTLGTAGDIAMSGGAISGVGNVISTESLGLLAAAGNVTITALNTTIESGPNSWRFDNSGNIILPNNGHSINYANGQPYGGSGSGTPGGNNTEVQFNNNGEFGGSANLVFDGANLRSQGDIVAGNSLQVDGAGGDITGAINVIASGNVNAGNINTVGVGGDITMTGGNITGANVVAANTVVGNGNLQLQPDPANTGSYLDIFLTSGPDLHLVASAAANLILGKDDGANVMTSWNGNAYVQSWNLNTGNVGGTWTFGGDGNLTTPGAINVGDMSIGELPGYITATANTGIILNVSGPDGGFVVDYLKEDGNANTSQGELAFGSETGNTTYRISLTDDAGDGFATKIWRFDGTGNITLPGGGSVYSEGFTPSGNPGNTIVLNPHGSGSITNQKLMLYPTAGDGDHLHMTTGNLYQTELFLGSDDFYVKLANTGNVVINSNDGVGNVGTWTFDNTGHTTLPTVNNESAQFVGTRKIVGGITLTSPYSTALAAGGTSTVAYTASSSNMLSVKVTFALQSGGSRFQWEQFDVVATQSQDVSGTVNYVVSNRVKGTTGVADTAVTASINGSGAIEISLNLAASQTAGGASSFDAVEFGLMID